MAYNSFDFALWSAITTYSILALQSIFLAFYTGFQRKRTKTPASPEDSKMLGGSPGEGAQLTEGGFSPVDRAIRMHANHLENVVPFFLASMSLLITAPEAYTFGVLCFIFLFARIAHSICYALGLQPFRGICFGVGVLITIVMVGWALIQKKKK